MSRRRWLVYGVLFVIWALILAWQVAEHRRVEAAARTALINRSRDITTTLGLVIRSQRRWNVVSQERLESALKELVKSGELTSVALLNATGNVVASAGKPIDFQAPKMMQTGIRWEQDSVTVINLVDLGASIADEGEPERRTIVLPKRDPDDKPNERGERGERPHGPPRSRGPDDTNNTATAGSPPGPSPNRERPRRPWGRPWWMDEKEYAALLQNRGLHGLALAMSTANLHSERVQDLWMRWIILCLATVSAFGVGFAWRNLAKSSELQMRLLRASEMNSHLKEMNLAAAGLAHETRNPLNIIRGLAQLISKQSDASVETRKKSRDIVDETDRVTAQLNQFINYSRPREVRRSAVALGSVADEVARALSYDLEEKEVTLKLAINPITIEADEQLLRQALFNLVLNAVQAVEPKGEICIRAGSRNSSAILEVCDNGPGVAPEHRNEIFKPYFTTHQKGTGLGLSVVQQIVLAHGWEIECLANQPHGACFRLTHLKIASSS